MGEQPQAERPRRRARAAILAQTPPSAEDAFAVLSENSTATDLIAFVGKWGQRNVAAGERTPISHFRVRPECLGRRGISGIVHVLRTGCRWQDCPAVYGPSTTVYNRFRRWTMRGTSVLRARGGSWATAAQWLHIALRSTKTRRHDSSPPTRFGLNHKQIVELNTLIVWSLEHASPHAVEIRPADLAERQKRIGIGALGQCIFRELPELDTRPQCNLHNGSEHGLRCTHNVMRGE